VSQSEEEEGEEGVEGEDDGDEEGGRGRRISMSLRPAWSTEQVPRQPGLHGETPSSKNKNHSKKE